MNIDHHWQDIAFLPVVNSLVEERLKKIDSIQNHFNLEDANKDVYRDIDNIEWFDGLHQLWQKIPNKTPRQIEWLNALEHRIDAFKNRLLKIYDFTEYAQKF